MIRKILNKLEHLSGSYKKLQSLERVLLDERKNVKINLGQLQAAVNKDKKAVSSLADVEFQVFSQFGDDGIIQWLVNKLPLPNKTFVEFGVEDYQEANTKFLLINNYWSGLVIDGSPANIHAFKSSRVHTLYDIQAECSFITTANINRLLSLANFKKDIGILSVDIDGNDYWVWNAIDTIQPVIVISEYNALFGYEHPYTIEYRDDFVRGTEYPFNFYGASLCSLNDLAKEKGYTFIGCNSAGNNAYFIRNDFMAQLPLQPLQPKEGYNFANFTEAYDAKTGEWLRGPEKIRSIDKLPVINTRTGAKELFNAASVIDSLLATNKLTRF